MMDRHWRRATVARFNLDGTCEVRWADGTTDDLIKNPEALRLRRTSLFRTSAAFPSPTTDDLSLSSDDSSSTYVGSG